MHGCVLLRRHRFFGFRYLRSPRSLWTQFLHDPALFHHQRVIGAGDGFRAMGDDHAGDVQAPDRGIDQLLVAHVQVAGRLVQEQQLRLPVKRTRQDDALFLTTGERFMGYPGRLAVAHDKRP